MLTGTLNKGDTNMIHHTASRIVIEDLETVGLQEFNLSEAKKVFGGGRIYDLGYDLGRFWYGYFSNPATGLAIMSA